MNHQHGALEIGICFAEVGGDLVAVAGVIGHHKQDGLFAELAVFVVGLAPFDHAKIEVISMFFAVDCAGSFHQPCAAGFIGQTGMLDHVLGDGFHERVVGNGLHENGTVVVAWRGADVELEAEG